jgi:hypothetical protein
LLLGERVALDQVEDAVEHDVRQQAVRIEQVDLLPARKGAARIGGAVCGMGSAGERCVN